MNHRGKLAELRASLKKQVAALTIFALGFSLLGIVTAPQASGYNFASQSTFIETSGRAGGTLKVRVNNRVASTLTSVPDQVAVGIYYLKTSEYGTTTTGITSSMFATTQAPTLLSNGLAKYDFSITAPSTAGSYYVITCITTSTTPLTYTTLDNLRNSQNDESRCNQGYIKIGGTPTRAIFSHKSLSANSISGQGNAEARAQVKFFDAAGFPTRLNSSELFTITSTSATLSASYGTAYSSGTGTIPSNSKALAFNSSSGDFDGAYRFVLSDSSNRSSTIAGVFESSFGSGNFSAPSASMSFSTNSFAASGYEVKVLNAAASGISTSFASGSDGKLYFWGTLTQGSSIYYGSSNWFSLPVTKPKKLDFMALSGQRNSTVVKKILKRGVVLSADGSLFKGPTDSENSIAAEKIDLEPLTFPSLGGVSIADATPGLEYLLDTTNRVWARTSLNFATTTDYVLVDLSSIGNPLITKVESTSNGSTLFMLTESGTVYTQGDNTNGMLGQDLLTSSAGVGAVALPQGVKAVQLQVGYDFAYIVTAAGDVWTWGNNSGGQQGKSGTLIPYSAKPILAILPIGQKGISWNINDKSLSFLASDSQTVYVAAGTTWQSHFFGAVNSIASISAYYYWVGGTYTPEYLLVQSDGRIYGNSGNYSNIGNCTGTQGYVRSVGQFGPVSTDDAITYSGIFLANDSTTVSVNPTFSLKTGETSTLQVVQPRTSCYNVDELTYKWDLDGSENYLISGVPTLSQTGYQAFNAVLNFATAGRKEIRLKLSTPDGLDLVLKFTVGVEARVAPIIDFGDTRTGLISGSNSSALGIGTDGLLYTWGDNSYGQLSTTVSAYGYRYLALPVALPNGAKPLTVYSYEYSWSYRTNFVVDTAGKVWGSGSAFGVSGGSGNIETFTALSHLSSYNIVDIQATLNRAVALTKSGQIITWLFGRTDSARVPNQIVSLAGINVKNFTIQYDGNSGHRISAVDTDGALWQVPIASDGTAGDATKVNSIIDVRQLSWNGNQATLVTGSGGVWYSVNGATPFAQVSLPVGVTAVDAMYSGTLYLLDSTKKIWTANPSQSGNTVTMSTWTAYAAQANGQASSSDQPIFQHRGSSFISFASGNLMYLGSYDNSQAGRCNVYSSSYSGNRVFSTGQFGVVNVADQIITTASVAIASQNAANFSNGQFFSANPSDAVVIRLVNPRSGCFNGSSQLTAVADTAGSGTFNTAVPLSNDGGGTYSFTLSATAPSSGRKNISVRISTPLGTSSTIALGLGVFGTETITAVVPRTSPINTSQAAVFAVASDGFAYGWSTPTDVSYNYQGTTMSFMNMITSTPPRNSGSPTKLEMPGGVRVREAIPFTQCCTNSYSRYMFGVLAVDVLGRTWTWGTDSTLEVANGYTYQNTPLTPTQIPTLVGENVVRLSMSNYGNRALALTSKGVVYQWYAGDRNTPTRVASLAGLKIVDIYTNSYISFALADTGELYAFDGRGYYAGISATGNAIYSYLPSAQKVDLAESVTAIMPLSDSQLTAVKTASGKVYVWGILYNEYNGNAIQLLTPTRIDLPSSRTANLAGSIHSSSYTSNVITASDGTWWDLTINAQNQLTYYQRTGVSTAVNTSVRAFAAGSGQAMALQDGSIYTTNRQIAGTCGPIGTYTRVMSEGQFGPLYKADQIYITVNGNEITRPNTATSVSLTGWSACDGGANITMSADYVGNNVFGDTRTATVSQDGSRSTSTFTFTKTQNGPVYMQFKATTAAGLSGTETFFTKVVPAPLPGRQIGISVNAGDRYTNSSNVNLSLVWPDGTTKIFVSNDGGFAPGTVSDYDLQYTVPWVLPPQAVIPLPSIVYARFDNDPTTYYFDDIILDAIVPVLTYASAR
jgi:alpha-tubulin suppressor-like RCC1 family protein